MKTQALLFRIPVVMLSLLLMIAYVYTAPVASGRNVTTRRWRYSR